jgi:hypothetical protein
LIAVADAFIRLKRPVLKQHVDKIVEKILVIDEHFTHLPPPDAPTIVPKPVKTPAIPEKPIEKPAPVETKKPSVAADPTEEEYTR